MRSLSLSLSLSLTHLLSLSLSLTLTPAFSASTLGKDSRLSANALMEYCSIPGQVYTEYKKHIIIIMVKLHKAQKNKKYITLTQTKRFPCET